MKYYQDFYCNLSFDAPIHIGLLEEYGAHVTNAIVVQLTLALKYNYSIRRGVESMHVDAKHIRASKVKLRGQLDWLPAPDISDTLQPFDLTFTNRTRPGSVANRFVQTRILNVSDVIVRTWNVDGSLTLFLSLSLSYTNKHHPGTGAQDIKILWGVTSSWKSRSATPEDEEEEDVEEVKNMNELFYKTPRRPRLSTSQSHQDRFARNVSREAAWVALRAARAAKAAQIESMKLVMPCYDVKTQINIPFVCVTIINDFGFGGLPLAQFHFRFATLMLRDEPDLLSSKPKRSVRLSVVCSALGYSSNVSTWEELMSPWTLSIDMNSKEEEKTTIVSDDDHQDRILRRLSERSESNIFIRTAGAINLTFTVELLNSLILSLNKFQSEIVKNVGSNTTDSPLQVSTPPSSPHLLSRQTEDEMIGVGMFYLRIENRCGVPQYFVHEMYVFIRFLSSIVRKTKLKHTSSGTERNPFPKERNRTTTQIGRLRKKPI